MVGDTTKERPIPSQSHDRLRQPRVGVGEHTLDPIADELGGAGLATGEDRQARAPRLERGKTEGFPDRRLQEQVSVREDLENLDAIEPAEETHRRLKTVITDESFGSRPVGAVSNDGDPQPRIALQGSLRLVDDSQERDDALAGRKAHNGGNAQLLGHTFDTVRPPFHRVDGIGEHQYRSTSGQGAGDLGGSHVAYGRELGSPRIPADRRPAHTKTRAGQRTPNAVNRDERRSTEFMRRTQRPPGERRHHAGMNVNDVDGVRGEDFDHLVPSPRMDRQIEGQVSGDPVYRHSIDNVIAGKDLRRAAGRRDDTDIVTVSALLESERPDLGLNAASPWQVAVGDMCDSHGVTVRHNGCMLRTPTRRRTIVFVHAHPDDEALLTAGTMARASSQGLRVVLIVATDGEAGLTSAELSGNLALRRRAELAASADALGVDRIESLGYPDSGLNAEHPLGFAHQDTFAVADRISAILDEVEADFVVGYDPAGGYGHPDHLQVHRVTRQAAALAHQTPHLFEATLPREPIARAVALAARTRLTPSGFDPASFAGAWTPSAEITHRINVRPYLRNKLASLRAHASQATADGTIRTLAVLTRAPGPLQHLLLGTEYYVAVPASTNERTRSTASGAS